MEQNDLGKCTSGLQPNVAACLSYAVGLITGIIFYLTEKDNKFVRFHAMQSIITFGALFVAAIVIGIIPVLGWIIALSIHILSIILWVILMIKAYQGEFFKLPIAGDIAEQNS